MRYINRRFTYLLTYDVAVAVAPTDTTYLYFIFIVIKYDRKFGRKMENTHAYLACVTHV